MARVRNPGGGSFQGGTPLPSASEVIASLDSYQRQNLRRYAGKPNDRRYIVDFESAAGAYAIMGQGRRSGFVSPFSSLPTAAQSGEFGEARETFELVGENLEDGYDYYLPEEYKFDASRGGTGIGYRDLSQRQAPAPLSVVPTSTTNPERPRTVAAGYDVKRKTLTVVFRDGTFYNYYEVGPDEWAYFKSKRSKGEVIRERLDSHPRGYADINSNLFSESARFTLYQISRTSQIHYDGRQQNRASKKAKPKKR